MISLKHVFLLYIASIQFTKSWRNFKFISYSSSFELQCKILVWHNSNAYQRRSVSKYFCPSCTCTFIYTIIQVQILYSVVEVWSCSHLLDPPSMLGVSLRRSSQSSRIAGTFAPSGQLSEVIIPLRTDIHQICHIESQINCNNVSASLLLLYIWSNLCGTDANVFGIRSPK